MEELIKKSDAIKAIEALAIHTDERYLNDLEYGHNEGLAHAIDCIEDIPSADRPQGEWILECDGEGECDNLYRCSECGCEYGCQEYDIPNFCPNCGARMKG